MSRVTVSVPGAPEPEPVPVTPPDVKKPRNTKKESDDNG